MYFLTLNFNIVEELIRARQELEAERQKSRDLLNEKLSEGEFLKRANVIREKISALEAKIYILEDEDNEQRKVAKSKAERLTSAAGIEPIFARAMQDMYQGKGEGKVQVPTQKRALNSSNGSGLLGITVNDEGNIFAPLAGSALEQMGVEIVDVENETTRVAKVDFGAMSDLTPYNETDTIPVGSLSVAAVDSNLTNRGVIIKVHNNLLRGKIMDRTELLIRRAISAKIQEELLKELLIGKTKGFTGLDNIVGIQTVDAANAPISNWEKFVSAYTKILDYNGNIANISAVIPPVVFEQIQNLKDSTNQYLVSPPGLKDMKMIPCSIIKKNYGAGTDRTRAYVGDFSAVKILLEDTYLLMSEHRYLEEDVTAFRIIVRADMQVHTNQHIVRVENIDY